MSPRTDFAALGIIDLTSTGARHPEAAARGPRRSSLRGSSHQFMWVSSGCRIALFLACPQAGTVGSTVATEAVEPGPMAWERWGDARSATSRSSRAVRRRWAGAGGGRATPAPLRLYLASAHEGLGEFDERIAVGLG